MQQAASTARDLDAPRVGPWLFELPLATPQGAAVAQFQIDADEPHHTGEDADRVWRARFTLDLAGVGPVHVNLALRQSDLNLSLWAESGDTAVRLDQTSATLLSALQAQALNAHIAVRPGAPETRVAPPGRFADSAV
jgi:hypothetical protein